jgi:ABC-type transporter Mla maintaining outer membrane lipid asymmetry permease subunit MlaE
MSNKTIRVISLAFACLWCLIFILALVCARWGAAMISVIFMGFNSWMYWKYNRISRQGL